MCTNSVQVHGMMIIIPTLMNTWSPHINKVKTKLDALIQHRTIGQVSNSIHTEEDPAYNPEGQ